MLKEFLQTQEHFSHLVIFCRFQKSVRQCHHLSFDAPAKEELVEHNVLDQMFRDIGTFPTCHVTLHKTFRTADIQFSILIYFGAMKKHISFFFNCLFVCFLNFIICFCSMDIFLSYFFLYSVASHFHQGVFAKLREVNIYKSLSNSHYIYNLLSHINMTKAQDLNENFCSYNFLKKKCLTISFIYSSNDLSELDI